MELRITKIGQKFVVKLDNSFIPNVKDYEIKSSANGKTELMLILEFEPSISDLLTKTQ